MSFFMRNLTIGVAAAAAAMLIAMNAASAAPQILAVAASNQPIPFTCTDGVCEVEVSAMCLQKERRFPDSQTVYRPHDDQSFALVARDAEGNERRIVAADVLTIRSKRSFTAVRISVAEQTLKNLGIETAALEIAGGASLIPEDVAGDWFPQTADDIARATGPLRQLAAGWLDAGDDRAEASRLVSTVLNGLPDGYKVAQSTYEQAWLSAEAARRDDMSAEAFDQARAIYERCLGGSPYGNYRQCLEKNHDAVLFRMNTEYWDAVKTGS